MAIRTKTAKVDIQKVNRVAAAVRLVASPDFADRAFDMLQVGQKSLSYIKRIFPRSKASYPARGDTFSKADRKPLYRGWVLQSHSVHPRFGKNRGFTLRRENPDDPRDAEIIRALDQGSKAYSRIIPKGGHSAFLKTNKWPTPQGRSFSKIGDWIWVTGDGEVLQYKSRRGLHFMDKTFTFVKGLVEEAKIRYSNEAVRKIQNAAT